MGEVVKPIVIEVIFCSNSTSLSIIVLASNSKPQNTAVGAVESGVGNEAHRKPRLAGIKREGFLGHTGGRAIDVVSEVPDRGHIIVQLEHVSIVIESTDAEEVESCVRGTSIVHDLGRSRLEVIHRPGRAGPDIDVPLVGEGSVNSGFTGVDIEPRRIEEVVEPDPELHDLERTASRIGGLNPEGDPVVQKTARFDIPRFFDFSI